MRDVAKVHFAEIREHIVAPMLKVIEWSSTSMILLSRDKSEKQGKLSNAMHRDSGQWIDEGYDNSLLKHFLDNHYPIIKELWDNFTKNYAEARAKYAQLNELVLMHLITGLNNFRVQYSDARTGQNDMLEPIDELHDKMMWTILEQKYDDGLLQHIVPLDTITFDKVSFYRCDKTNGSNVLLELRDVCRMVNGKSEIKEAVKAIRQAPIS